MLWLNSGEPYNLLNTLYFLTAVCYTGKVGYPSLSESVLNDGFPDSGDAGFSMAACKQKVNMSSLAKQERSNDYIGGNRINR